jgi:hypothetical protein
VNFKAVIVFLIAINIIAETKTALAAEEKYRKEKNLKCDFEKKNKKWPVMISFSTNLGGATDLGTDIGIEIGKAFTGIFKVRFMNTGVMPYVLGYVYSGSFKLGFGYEGALRAYLGTKKNEMNGQYIEVSLEYLEAEAKTEGAKQTATGDAARIANRVEAKFLLPKILIGYRESIAVISESADLFIEIGAWTGFVFPIKIIELDEDGASHERNASEKNGRLPYAGLVFKLGVKF